MPPKDQLCYENEIAPFLDASANAMMLGYLPRIILNNDGTSTIEQYWANEKWKSTYALSQECISIIRSQYAQKYEDGSTLTNWIE